MAGAGRPSCAAADPLPKTTLGAKLLQRSGPWTLTRRPRVWQSEWVPAIDIRPKHQPVRAYYSDLQQFSLLHATHEGAVSSPFAALLRWYAKKCQWTLVPQFPIKRKRQAPLRVDGALIDAWSLVHGYWEAKDEDDDLAAEVKRKIAVGYPTDNILFQAPDRAILYQHGKRVLDQDITAPEDLVDVLKAFFAYQPPQFDQWERAADEFRDKVPQLGQALLELIDTERRKNPRFVAALAKFVDVCRRSLNPKLSEVAVEKMLAQHVLTERIFRKVFSNSDFVRRNAVAAEIELVVDKLTERSFDRDKFLAGLDRFYRAIEETAASIEDFTEKQHFLNTVYEKFFQGFDAKTADTHGIVYTPQSIVTFMVRSVERLLREEFDRSLAHKCVHILDPFVGTGNYILHVMRAMPRSRVPEKYATELHANEVMLLPYYIASMNIEHEYHELVGTYEPFEGLCLVDTFELAEPEQKSLLAMTERNAARVEKQRRSPITVVIGNPPYNAWQKDENDRNKNRAYPVIDDRVAQTYARDSSATLKNSFSDPYVKAFRWASDRIGEEGVVAYVSNSSYVHKLAMDGMRRHLAQDFDRIYVLDLGGNVRTHPHLSGTTHNVFGIQVGVAIGLFVRHRRPDKTPRSATIFYASTGEDWRREKKYGFLEAAGDLRGIEWTRITPNETFTWLTAGLEEDFASFLAMGTKEDGESVTIFQRHCRGACSNNDSYVYNFSPERLTATAKAMVEAYNGELDRWRRTLATTKKGDLPDVDDFVKVDESVLKWIRKTKKHLRAQHPAVFSADNIRPAIYRPFCRQFLFFDPMFNEDLYQLASYFPKGHSNTAICVTDVGSERPFMTMAVNEIPDLHLVSPGCSTQVFPFYTYDAAGTRTENISDAALEAFRRHYKDSKITKRDLFHYVYAVLHHPDYRSRYAANLKQTLPRIPLAPRFAEFSRIGKALMSMHLNFDSAPEYDGLEHQEMDGEPVDWTVERMKLVRDQTSIVYNSYLSLSGIPPAAFEYRLGNRSALDWAIEQLGVSTDKRSGITNDPNRLGDQEAVVRLIKKVITISLETMRLVNSLPPLRTAGERVRAAPVHPS